MLTTQQALIDEITSAFEGVERGNGVTLHEATVIDSYGSLEERAKARLQDTEKRWQDVPKQDIANVDAVLSFLDDEGFHYYIPAYVVWYLKNIDNAAIRSSNTFDSVVFHLTYNVEEGRESRFERLTKEQKRAIAHFLTFVAQREEAIDRKDYQLDMAEGGMTLEEIESTLRDYFAGNPTCLTKALAQYWNQFL